MRIKARIEGMDKLATNIASRVRAASKGYEEGGKAAAVHVQRESQKMVPRDIGALIGSADTRKEGVGFQSTYQVVYTAEYAAAVHEMVGMKLKGLPRADFGRTRGGESFGGGSGTGKYWDPQGRAQAKFLEKAYRNNMRKSLETVATHTRTSIAEDKTR